MRNIWAIGLKEIRTYIGSPIAYVVAIVFLVLAGRFFALSLSGAFPEATIRGFLNPAILLVILVCPALTMRLLAEEQKLGTLELLLTAPVRDAEVVLGKFLGSLVVMAGILALTLYFPALLFIFGDPDFMPILTGYLGILLVAAMALSIGLFGSALTSNQIVALVVSLGVLLLLSVAGQASQRTGGLASDILNYLALNTHTQDLFLGVVDSRHLLYFLSFIVLFLFITIRVLESRRWR